MKTFLKFNWPSIIMAGAVALFTLSVKASIREELKNYITKEEFARYEMSHQKWGDEVIRGLRDDVAKMREELREFRREMNLKQQPTNPSVSPLIKP